MAAQIFPKGIGDWDLGRGGIELPHLWWWLEFDTGSSYLSDLSIFPAKKKKRKKKKKVIFLVFILNFCFHKLVGIDGKKGRLHFMAT